MKPRTPLAIAVALVSVCLVLATGPTFARTSPTTSRTTSTTRATTSTAFAFKTSGYGTKVTGGRLPAGSSTTGYDVIGCTNKAGRMRTNNVAEATVPGLGEVSGVRTRVWTTSRHGVVASHSAHAIAAITIARSDFGSLSIGAVTSTSTAYHDSSGFHAKTSTHVGDLVFTPASGPDQVFALPTPDHPLTIPGLVTVYAGQHTTHENASGADADAYALRVEVLATGTSVRVAHSRAGLFSGVTGGVFGGHAAATHVVTAGGDIVASGPNPLLGITCQGTHGRTREKSLASLDLGGQLVVEGADSRVRGTQRADEADGMTRAAVARVSLGGGQVVIDGIVGKASVVRMGHHVRTSARGTRLASISVNGREQAFPKSGVLEIPGLVKLERAVVTRSPRGVSVIGLRITLLDGSGAVVDLAEARLRIRPTGA
jgi:hypothetical protein